MTHDPRYNYYQVLMLAETADAEIISTVYRKLAQRYHPDVDPVGRGRASDERDQRGVRDAARPKSGASTTRGSPAGATAAQSDRLDRAAG